MAQLSNKQKQLFDIVNHCRITLTNQFRQQQQPSVDIFARQLLKVEAALLENMHSHSPLLSEVIDNLTIIIFHKNYQTTQHTNKHKLKWERKPKKELIINQILQQPKNIFKKQPNYQPNNQPPSNQPSNNQPLNNHPSKSSAEFVSASTLPKGTSVRKKFVPPFKKAANQGLTYKEEGQNDEEKGDPRYKNLQPKLIASIESEILQKNGHVSWDKIAGLGFAKKIINQIIVWPMLRPDIFTGLRAPPKGILLFGPPGTGKTMIGRAIASQAAATFFNISASSLTSKWVGESQKLVKTLFTIARFKQPSVIFIDEIDSLLSARSEGQQQSSRKIKTQFLVELDGAKTNTDERVLIIGATNRPQQLDDAVLRRFVKRLYIPLPNLQGRKQLLNGLTSNGSFEVSQKDIEVIAEHTKGYSGADIYSLCSQASMVPLRNLTSIQNIRNSEVPLAKLSDCLESLKLVRPSVNRKLLKSFQDWNESFGSYQFNPDELQNQC